MRTPQLGIAHASPRARKGQAGRPSAAVGIGRALTVPIELTHKLRVEPRWMSDGRSRNRAHARIGELNCMPALTYTVHRCSEISGQSLTVVLSSHTHDDARDE